MDENWTYSGVRDWFWLSLFKVLTADFPISHVQNWIQPWPLSTPRKTVIAASVTAHQ